MEKSWKTKTSPRAEKSIKEIGNYISKFDVNAAGRVVGKIFAKIESLKDNPRRGANLRNKVEYSTNLKYILAMDNYAIIYRIESELVRVLLVKHTAGDMSYK